MRAAREFPTLTAMTTNRIDVHHHYVPAELIEELDRVGIHHVGGQPLAPSRPADSLAVLDRYEIATALLSVPIPLTFGHAGTSRRVARSINEIGAEAVVDEPERFGLFATLPLPDVDGAMDELDYALDTLRADGVILLSNHARVYLGDPRLEPVFAELDRRASVVLVHPAVYTGDRLPIDPHAGSPVPTLEPSLFEFVFDTNRAVASLIVAGALRRHPNLRLILAHAGGTAPYVRDRILDRAPILRRMQRAREGEASPPTAEELQGMVSEGLAESRSQLQNLFYDVTLSTNDTVLGCLHDLVPSSRILLGTDYPMAQEIGVASTLAGLEGHAGFDDDDRRAIESDSARQLFPRLNNWAARIPRAGDFAGAGPGGPTWGSRHQTTKGGIGMNPFPAKRFVLAEHAPRQYAGMLRLEESIELGERLRELIRLRASQINGCAVCIDMHWKDARVTGESEERLYSLDAWRESPLYSARERAALELCEAMTLVAESHVPDRVWDRAAMHFGPAELAQLVFAITAINAWNRLLITARTEPGHYQPRVREVA